MSIRSMLIEHPNYPVETSRLGECIDYCFACAAACESCADACISESTVESLRRCIALCESCAEICITTGRILTRLNFTEPSLRHELLILCERSCRACALECEQHASMHSHCRVCAEFCRSCEATCQTLSAALGAKPIQASAH